MAEYGDEKMERHPLCRKIYLELAPPTEEDARGDRERILDGLTGEYTTDAAAGDAKAVSAVPKGRVEGDAPYGIS